jgi:hypothetical protein
MQRLAKSAVLGAVLTAGFAMAAMAQTPRPDDRAMPAPPAIGEHDAHYPYSGGSYNPDSGAAAPAQIEPPPVDPWHQLNNERTIRDLHIGIGG